MRHTCVKDSVPTSRPEGFGGTLHLQRGSLGTAKAQGFLRELYALGRILAPSPVELRRPGIHVSAAPESR